jgi:hypothetical protein
VFGHRQAVPRCQALEVSHLVERHGADKLRGGIAFKTEQDALSHAAVNKAVGKREAGYA